MKWAAVDSAARGSAQHDRNRRSPAEMRLGQQVHDLVEGATDEVHELELGDGAHAGQRGAEAGVHDGHLGDGRIHDALRAEAVDEAFGDLERAAVNADVLADAEDGRVALHLFPDALADRFEISDRCHRVATNCLPILPVPCYLGSASGRVTGLFSWRRHAPDICPVDTEPDESAPGPGPKSRSDKRVMVVWLSVITSFSRIRNCAAEFGGAFRRLKVDVWVCRRLVVSLGGWFVSVISLLLASYPAPLQPGRAAASIRRSPAGSRCRSRLSISW